MYISDDALSAERNNFTAMRLLLASSVIYTHCFYIVYGLAGADDLSPLLGAPISAYAVDGFFVLSGFLVYPSLMRLKSSWRFLTARFARIWPGLALCIGLTVLAGAFVTTAEGADYLGGDTARFILKNLTFTAAAYNLTGVECGGAACTLNGSLWTLPWEVRCYLLLALLGVLGLARPATMTRLVLPATLVGALAWDIPWTQTLVGNLLGDSVVYLIGVFDRLWFAFALGVAAYLFRARILLSWWILAGLAVATILAHRVGLDLHLRAVTIGYAVLCGGLLTARRRAVSATWPDYSYGMYIYGYPVMVALYAVWPTSSHMALTGVTMALTVIFAAFSWHLVEHPALALHRRWRSRGREASAGRAATAGKPTSETRRS